MVVTWRRTSGWLPRSLRWMDRQAQMRQHAFDRPRIPEHGQNPAASDFPYVSLTCAILITLRSRIS